MRKFTSTLEHEGFYQDLNALLKRYAEMHNMTGLEMLAIAANLVGKLLALQDQRTITSQQALDVVVKNIQEGNQQVVVKFAADPSAGSA